MTSALSISSARKRLTIVWFTGAGIVLLLVILQSVLGRYENDVTSAFEWFLPTVMPTLSLIIGVLALDIGQGRGEGAGVDRFFFRLTMAISVAYLLLVLGTILMQPLASVAPVELLSMSNLWLAPTQGLATGAIGAFFVSSSKK